MKEVKININNVNKAKEFCRLSENSTCTSIDLKSGRYVVDARSLLGIFSLDLSKELVCIINGFEEEEDKFEKSLKEANLLV